MSIASYMERGSDIENHMVVKGSGDAELRSINHIMHLVVKDGSKVYKYEEIKKLLLINLPYAGSVSMPNIPGSERDLIKLLIDLVSIVTEPLHIRITSHSFASFMTHFSAVIGKSSFTVLLVTFPNSHIASLDTEFTGKSSACDYVFRWLETEDKFVEFGENFHHLIAATHKGFLHHGHPERFKFQIGEVQYVIDFRNNKQVCVFRVT